MFRDRNYRLHPDFSIEEIARLLSNQQIVKALTLVAVGGLAAGTGVTLAMNWLGQQAQVQRVKHELFGWFLSFGGRKIYWYSEALESTLFNILEPFIEEEALKYERGIGSKATSAAMLDAIVKEERNILLFVVEKPEGDRPFVKHIQDGWLYHEDKGDQFILRNEKGQKITRFERKEIVNIFQLKHRPCLVIRIYPET